MSLKCALVIGNTEYTDPGLAQLTAPGKDAEDFAKVLRSKELCAFDDVRVLMNEPEPIVREAIDEFFDEKKPDDLLVLYFSGHGVRDDLGALYLAVKNTNRFRLRSTAIKSDFIRETMDQSRSRRQLLILDCCNSGAFAQGMKAATGVSLGTASAFEGGYGRVILTASDSTQFAWEGDKVIGETDNSLFTHFLVEGLKGKADLDGDGRITVDELYDYTYEKVKIATPKQTPSKFSTKQQGEIVLRQDMREEDIKPIPLPDELMDEIEDTRPYVREAAVQKLEKILGGKSIGMARSAKWELEKIATQDDSRRVSHTAEQALASARQREQKLEEEQKARAEAEHRAALKAEEEQRAYEKIESERKAREDSERMARAKVAQEAPQIKREWDLPADLRARERERRQAIERIPAKRTNNVIRGAIVIGVAICFIGIMIIVKSYNDTKAAELATQRAYYEKIYEKTNAGVGKAIATTQTVDLSATYQATRNSSLATLKAQATIDAQSTLDAESATSAQATEQARSVHEYFNDNLKEWRVGEWNQPSWNGTTNIDNSLFTITVANVSKGFSQRINFPGNAFADFDLQVDGLSEYYSGTNNEPVDIFCYGIFFRELEGSYYKFSICSRTYSVSYFDGTNWNNLISSADSAAINPSKWNTLRVSASGSNFYLYINNAKVDYFSDSRNKEGDVGLWFQTRSNLKPGRIWFDNFILNNVK